jgi:hypothetical protein
MHVLPRVRELEERFADSLTVIGVHAGKYSTERVTERIAAACDRLGVVHAVVNDRQFRVWRDYAVNAWPTVVVIDPEGYVALIAEGEFEFEAMSAELSRIAERAEARGTLVRGPDPSAPSLQRHEGPLRFPTRVVLDGARLWVADTGHGRVLECAWDARERTAAVVAEHADFVEPRGLAALGGHMHVADRAGHAVWRLDGGERVRVAGTGRLGRGALAPGPAHTADLRSPWGLAAAGGRLAIAMAGTHQLWLLDPDGGALSLLAGTGGEGIADGPPARAALAQPTGLAALPGGAFAFADCESSAVRVADARSVETLVGTGLFDFGDRDGVGDAALLQHCEDVAVHGGILAAADTYNDRVKRIEPVTRECAPWPGEAGETGSLREPAGIWSDGSILFVADTGHHRVVVVEPDGSLAEVRFA